MNGRTEHEVKADFSLAEVDQYCFELSDQMFELVFKDAFKGDRDTFNAAFKLDLSSYDTLTDIIAKWGDANTTTAEINAKLKTHISNAIKAGIIQLPAEKEAKDQLTRTLGNFFRTQIAIAQLKYHWVSYAYQAKAHDKDQAILAAKVLEQLLPRVINRTEDMASAKHSFSLFGFKITQPAFYNEDASILRAVHEKLNAQSEQLLKFAKTITSAYSPVELKGEFHQAEMYFNEVKAKRKAVKKRIVSSEEIYLDRDDIQKKQAAIPTPFIDSENTVEISPVMDAALKVREKMLKDEPTLKQIFADLHKEAAENKASIEQTLRAERLANLQRYQHEQEKDQEQFTMKLTAKPAKRTFIQSFKNAVNRLMDRLNKAFNIIIMIVLNEVSKTENQKPGRDTRSMIQQLGGVVSGTSKIDDEETKAHQKAMEAARFRRDLVKKANALSPITSPVTRSDKTGLSL